MQRTHFVVLVAVCLLLPYQTHAFRRWNWRKIGENVIKWAPVVVPLLGRNAAAVDTNQDGVIDHEELARAVGERATLQEMEDFMTLADIDGDGAVSRRELDATLI